MASVRAIPMGQLRPHLKFGFGEEGVRVVVEEADRSKRYGVILHYSDEGKRDLFLWEVAGSNFYNLEFQLSLESSKRSFCVNYLECKEIE